MQSLAERCDIKQRIGGCFLIVGGLVAERSQVSRSEGKSVKRARIGEIGSENADMSSDKQCERHCRRKSKGSCLRLIRAG